MTLPVAIILAAAVMAPRVRADGGPGGGAGVQRQPVAIVGLEVAEALAEARDAILVGIEKGLGSAGFSVLPTATTLAAGASASGCEDPVCFRQLGARISASYLVFASVTAANDSFSVTVSLVRADDGRELARHNLTCASLDPCAPVPESARNASREAARTALGALISLTNDMAIPAGRPIQVEASATANTPAPAGGLRWPFVASGAVAAAAVATGIVLIAINHDRTDCHAGTTCLNRYSTLLPGIAATAGGGLLAVATAIGYRLWGARFPAGVAVGPGSLSLSVANRF